MSSPSTHSFDALHLASVPVRPVHRAPSEYSGKREATRQRLMDACAELIVQSGFEAISMTAVAEEAGITRQTVYRYFSNSRALVRATLMRGGRELLEGQLVVFGRQGEPKELLVDAVMSAIGVVRHNALLRTAWASRDYPQAMLRSIFDPSFAVEAVEGLRPIAQQLGWSERDSREAYELIARTVMSFLTMPPRASQSDAELRDLLRRRLLPALGA